MQDLQRRPIKLRSADWSRTAASKLAEAGVTPNQVSVASTIFALAGAAAFITTTISATELCAKAAFVCAACFIQLRLLCNMLDGLIAVENGKATASGELYNEIPDRISDSVLLVAAGCAAGSLDLGWLAALLSLMTAYIRAFGARYMVSQDFSGPMAKQHRMFALTVGAIASALQYAWIGSTSMFYTMIIICAGTAYTAWQRTLNLKQAMEKTQ